MSNTLGLPARCIKPACGHVFWVTNLIGGAGSGDIFLSQNSTSCPLCGSMAMIGDGLYQLSKGSLILKDGPTLTHAMLARLTEIAQSAKSKSIETQELLTEVAGVSPEFAEKIRRLGLPTAVIILLLLWMIKSVEINVTVDLNKLIDQAQEAVADNPEPSVFDTPPPIPEAEPSESPRSTLAVQSEAPVSRQVRRQLERQAKKLVRRDPRNA